MARSRLMAAFVAGAMATAMVAIGGPPPAVAATIASVIPAKPWLVGSEWLGINSGSTGGTYGGASVTTPAGATVPPGTFGSVRWWDEPQSAGVAYLPTRWCDIQPTPQSSIEANLRVALDPKLDAARRMGAKRVVLVLGHPAPWVYNDAAATTRAGLWFCGGAAASVSLPSSAFIGCSPTCQPGRTRWNTYVAAVLTHLVATYGSGARMPFEVDLQVWNEPTANSLAWATGVPNTAATEAEAASSLSLMDGLLRLQMDRIAGLDTARTTLLVSPITRTGTTAYLSRANAAQAASAGAYVHYTHRYDGVSIHTYSVQGPTLAKTGPQLVADYNYRMSLLLAALKGTYTALSSLPVYQTETNHGFALPGGVGQTANRVSSTFYTAADRSMLMARLVMDGLRWNLAGQFIYGFGAAEQYTLHLSPTSPVTLTTDTSFATLLRVRGWVVGFTFHGCRLVSGVVDCLLTNPATGVARHIVYSDTADSAAYKVLQTRRLYTADGSGNGTVTLTAGSTYTVGRSPVLLG